MRRRRGNGDSSLELLLDTICNTFGGVLFLAILVSLLLKSVGATSAASQAADESPRPAVSKSQLIRSSVEARELQDRLRRLDSDLASVRGFVTQFSTPDLAASLERLHAEQRRHDDLEAKKASALKAVAADQAARAAAAAAARAAQKRAEQAASSAEEEIARLDEARRRAAVLAEAAIKLEEAIESRQVIQSTGRAPRERTTSKKEFGLMLRYGRLYLMHVHDGGTREVNTKDFVVEEGVVTNTAKARPGAGIDITAIDGDVSLQGILAGYPASNWYPCLVVHPDSFDTFQIVKSQLVARGYEYRLLVTDDPVNDSGPGTGQVQ